MINKKTCSNILNIIKIRRSVRSFDDRPIEKEKMELILEAARLAPSSCNSQPWRFVVVNDKVLLKKIAKAQPLGPNVNKFLESAGVIIACVDEPKLFIHKAADMVNRDNQRIDVGIAMEHMVLVAAELGIGSCWIGWFSEKKVKELLRIPKKKTISVLLALGYPKNKTDKNGIGGIKLRPRKKLSEVACKNYYDENYG
jgi:nitroreductase